MAEAPDPAVAEGSDPSPAVAGRIHRALLALVVITIVTIIAVPDEPWTRLVEALLMATTVLLALRLAPHLRWLALVAKVTATAAVVAALVALVIGADGDVAHGLVVLLGAFVVAVAPVSIARALLRNPDVSVPTLAGALTVYLLIGLLFSSIYRALGAFDAPFFAQDDSETASEAVYFSFTTLTTTGFGDLTARSDLSRSFVVLQALLGEVYLVTVVALVVSHIGVSRLKR
jgi:Ion channel